MQDGHLVVKCCNNHLFTSKDTPMPKDKNTVDLPEVAEPYYVMPIEKRDCSPTVYGIVCSSGKIIARCGIESNANLVCRLLNKSVKTPDPVKDQPPTPRTVAVIYSDKPMYQAALSDLTESLGMPVIQLPKDASISFEYVVKSE